MRKDIKVKVVTERLVKSLWPEVEDEVWGEVRDSVWTKVWVIRPRYKIREVMNEKRH